MTIQARSVESVGQVDNLTGSTNSSDGKLRDEYLSSRMNEPRETEFVGSMTAGDAPAPTERGPVEKIYRAATPEKDMSLEKREEAVVAAFKKAIASEKKEDQEALAKALVQYFGNVKVQIDSKASKLLELACTGKMGDLVALTAARICLTCGTHPTHDAWGYRTIARVATKADDADVQKEAKTQFTKTQATMRKLVENGPDPDEKGLSPEQIKAIKDLKQEQVDAIKDYYRKMLKAMDEEVALAKKGK